MSRKLRTLVLCLGLVSNCIFFSQLRAETLVSSPLQSEDIIIETYEITHDSDEFSFLHKQNLKRDDQVQPDLPFDEVPTDGLTGLDKVINTFSDLIKKVLAPDTPLMKGSVIAEARPHGVTPDALQNSQYTGKTFRKLFKSLLGFKLIEVEYKISYAYAADHNGHGQYIPYVLFTPLKVVIDPLWHLEVDSLSLSPRNCGTLDSPIAALEFNLAFKAKGITGTIMATDTFSLNAKTGELAAEWRDFQP